MAKNRHPWLSCDDDCLRLLYGKRSNAELGWWLGRTAGAVKARANVLGLQTGRCVPWTEAEISLLREQYAQRTAADLAAELGRPVSQVTNELQRLGLRKFRRPFARTPQAEQRLRDLHAQGWTDSEIARDLDVERHSIHAWRKQLGLACNKHSERARRRVAANTAEQVRAAGLKSLAEVRSRARRSWARQCGWPEDLRPRAVQILNLLAAHGPMTRRQIADAAGMPWKGTRKSLVSMDPEGSYLAHLVARGLVVNLGRIHKGNGRGGSTCVYTLALNVRPQPPIEKETSHAAA